MMLWKRVFPVLLLVGLMSCAKAYSDNPSQIARPLPVNQSSSMISPAQNPVVDVVRRVREAVVQIRVEAKVTVQNNMNPFLDDPFFRYFFPEQPRVQQRPVTSMGSGFIYEYDPRTRDAYIMTNNHVVEKGREGTITVTLADKVAYTATIVGLDPNTDVAVIKINVKEGEKITVAPLGDSTKLEIGEWAIAIGNPFGESGLDRTVTLGVISAIGRSNLNFGSGSPIYQDYIQTDAAINPGNSGGPLLNIHGEVIGINAAITSTSGGNIGIGFAIPINLAYRVVEDLVATGKVNRAYIGISPQEITSDLMEALELSEVSGVLVSKVESGSPADKAGLQTGDVIVEFNGEKVPNVSKFRIAVATSKAGTQVPVRIIRDKKSMQIKIELEKFPDDVAAANEEKPATKVSSGITVEATDSQNAKRLGISGGDGVVVTKIDPNSPASRTNLQAGHVIMKINGIDITSVQDFNNVMETEIAALKTNNKKTILLYVMDRNSNYSYIALRFE